MCGDKRTGKTEPALHRQHGDAAEDRRSYMGHMRGWQDGKRHYIMEQAQIRYCGWQRREMEGEGRHTQGRRTLRDNSKRRHSGDAAQRHDRGGMAVFGTVKHGHACQRMGTGEQL